MKKGISFLIFGLTAIFSRYSLAGPCDKIASHTVMQKCYGEIAAEKNDLSICDQARLDMGFCYATFAVAKKDPSICERYDKEGKRDICYSEVGNEMQDPKICERIERLSDWKDGCYSYVAVAKKDIRLCDKTQSQDNTYHCYAKVNP